MATTTTEADAYSNAKHATERAVHNLLRQLHGTDGIPAGRSAAPS